MVVATSPPPWDAAARRAGSRLRPSANAGAGWSSAAAATKPVAAQTAETAHRPLPMMPRLGPTWSDATSRKRSPVVLDGPRSGSALRGAWSRRLNRRGVHVVTARWIRRHPTALLRRSWWPAAAGKLGTEVPFGHLRTGPMLVGAGSPSHTRRAPAAQTTGAPPLRCGRRSTPTSGGFWPDRRCCR